MVYGLRCCLIRLAPLMAFATLVFACAAAPAHAWSKGQAAAPASRDAGEQTVSADAARNVYSLPPEKLAKAVRLNHARTLLYFCNSIWMLIMLWILLETRTMATIRDWVQRGRLTRFHGLLVVAALVMLYSLAQLPASLVSHHLSLVYGLSVQGWAEWIKDWSKSTILFMFSCNFLAMCLMATIRRSPRRWWFWFWLMAMPLVVFTIYLMPKIVDPLYDHFEPLAATQPALVEQLERVATRGRVDIPPSRMFLMKASNKFTSINAYVTGFGPSKRVVVWDTTVQRASPDKIMFIYGHEQGHYVLNHVAKGLVGAFALALFLLWIGFNITGWLLRRRGERWRIASTDDWAAIGVLVLVFYFLNFLAQPIANAVSRTVEHRADIYGQEVIHGLVANPRQTAVDAFQQLGEESLDDPNPNPLFEFWTYDHPSTTERMRFAARYDPWAQGKHPRYFSPDR
jgi:STE24 endopeptidase